MSTVELPPEFAHGGFWYVVPATVGTVVPLSTFPAGFDAWYGLVDGAHYAAVRSPRLVIGVDTVNVPVDRVLAGHAARPYSGTG